MNRPVILIISPMPLFPTSAGNRKRLLATCDLFEREGFLLDFAYVAHEDQIYRRFGREPPTDMVAMQQRFRRVFQIELERPIKLKTRSRQFNLDDWCPDELEAFLNVYLADTPECGAVMVNYVFLSKCLEKIPDDIVKIIDTHDRFGDRAAQYAPSRGDPNFFYCGSADERTGLRRANIVLAIQDSERDYFESLIDRDVHLLPPELTDKNPFVAPARVRALGFLGHGNDSNLLSISSFADIWSRAWRPGLPILKIAGEICDCLPGERWPGIEMLGFVPALTDFYGAVDIVVAPMVMGTGLKLKIVEGLAHGKPILGTALAFTGLSSSCQDHLLADPEAVVRRAIAIAEDARGLKQLTDDCAKLFESYTIVARRSGDELIATVKSLMVRSGSEPIIEVPILPERTTTEFGGIRLIEENSAASPGKLIERGAVHVATERSLHCGGGIEVFSPKVRRWFIEKDPSGRCAEPSVSPLTERRIAVAPSMLASGACNQATLWAVRALAEASPDWSSLDVPVRRTSEGLVIEALWPSAILGKSVRRRSYLIPRAFQPAVSVTIVQSTALFCPLQRRSIVTKVCGNWPMVPASIRLALDCQDITWDWSGAIVFAAGLVGKIVFSESREER